MDDKSAMNHIANILDGTEWDSDTHERIASVVLATGRKLRTMDQDVIRVYVEGGIVSDVDGIPENTTVLILDTDSESLPQLSMQEYVSQET
jgi:hypothetical protein